MSAPAGPRDGAWVRMEKSCCGKHREEVSVSWIRAAVTLCSWPSSLCHRETAQAKGSPSPASLLILQNPELLAQLSIPGSCQQHQCPAQRFVELLSAKETPFLPRHFSGQTSSQSPATLPRLEKVILECLSLGVFFGFFCTLSSARHRFGMEKPGSCLGQGCCVSLGVAVGASIQQSKGSVGR